MLLTPHPDYERLRRALTRSPRLARPFSGTAYRSTSPAYAGSKDLVSGEGVRRHGARWNPPGLAAVYASLLPETAVAEALAQFRRAGIPEFAAMPRVLVALEVSLARVLPLTSGSVRRRLRVSGRRLVNEKWWEMQ
ncbi:MAG TPA: RES domain-containing protein, partial [Thermoanaerobaculia bacterium]